MTLSSSVHTASSVAQVQKGRVRGLGRGPRPKNMLNSSKLRPLKIIQCNINGILISAARIKLDQTLKLAEVHGAQITAPQETKLKETSQIKAMGYSTLRLDRHFKRDGGLAFLIRVSTILAKVTLFPLTLAWSCRALLLCGWANL